MDQENTIRERIDQIRNLYKWSENSIARDSATQKRLNRQLSHGGTITMDTLVLILEACPEVSADWLLLGLGEMKRSANSPPEDDSMKDIVRRFLSLLEEKDRQIDRILSLAEK